MPQKRLFRSKKNRMIAGVCAGIAEYMDVDPTVVRLTWAGVTVLTGFVPGSIAYLVAWFIMPEK